MASNIGNRGGGPKAPMWPWGGPRSIRERLVDPTQFDKKKKLKKLGNPKNPSLASMALLDWIGPGHTAEEMRLPLPPFPEGHDADLEGRNDLPNLGQVAERGSPQERQTLERNLARINVPQDRLERMKALLSRESQMLGLIGHLSEDMKEINRKMKEEQAGEGI
jgi:hypothetical protein